LHYNRYRYYSPYVGRFVSKDPIGLWGGINVYQYAASSISWVDPLGLQKTSSKQKQGSAKPEEGTPKKTCPHSNVVNALDGFKTKRYQFGSNTYILDKAAMTHILKRHHPEYWDGSIKSTQSFLCPNLSIKQIETEIRNVLQANREKLAESGANAKMFQLPKTNGRVVGLNRGRIGQFY
ncbi:RHS repeat-associated core domain-containing protein, partial [Acinetobacter nosocomialis]|uniref:RHS repeat-associated core domain-containing protein n=3 Tax=Acinetobacter TaxID=469 RepID=UPI0023B1C450